MCELVGICKALKPFFFGPIAQAPALPQRAQRDDKMIPFGVVFEIGFTNGAINPWAFSDLELFRHRRKINRDFHAAATP